MKKRCHCACYSKKCRNKKDEIKIGRHVTQNGGDTYSVGKSDNKSCHNIFTETEPGTTPFVPAPSQKK